MAKIIYAIEHFTFDDLDARNGWWLVRITISLRDGKPLGVLDKKRIAQFDCDGGDIDTTSEVLELDRALKGGEFQLLGRSWNLEDVR